MADARLQQRTAVVMGPGFRRDDSEYVAPSPPVQQPRLQQVDQLADNKPEHAEDHHARQQLIGLHEIAGLQHEGADAELGADHLGADHQEQRHRRGDAKACEDRGQRARPDHPADDGVERHVKALRHPDQIARHGVDAAVNRYRGGKEDAQRNGRNQRCTQKSCAGF